MSRSAKGILQEIMGFESQGEVEDFLEEQGVSGSALIQSLIFDKDVFETKAEAIEWATTHFFGVEDVVEGADENFFTIEQLDALQFVQSSFREIEIRRGVKALVGRIDEGEEFSPMSLSLRNPKNIKLSANHPHIIELAKVTHGFHPSFGEIDIAQETLLSFHNNHKNKVFGVDVSIDFDHDQREAAGWIKSTFLSVDNNTLFGEIRWTPKGALALSDREFRYFSPMFNRNFVHPHTREEYGPTLTGGALVNSPFLKMDPIVELKDKQPTEEDEMDKDTVSLAAHQKEVSSLTSQVAELKLSAVQQGQELIDAKSQAVTLSNKVKEMGAQKEKETKDRAYNKLFDENKINKAQLVALSEGKGLMDVLALSANLNTDAKGNGDERNADVVTLSDKEQAMCKSLNLTQEEYIAANKEAE